MQRRAALTLLLAASASACRRSNERDTMETHNGKTTEGRMPAIFVSHGSPLLLEDAKWKGELGAWAAKLPRPSAVLMLSAHWEDAPVTLGATRPVSLIYDFYGFPEELYRLTYAAPGAPALAERVRSLCTSVGPVGENHGRGLDHGAYVPLIAMYPEASVPVLQISIPTLDPRALFGLGRALAPLRREGVLVVGSGSVTHNLRALDASAAPVTPSWAAEFDAWVADVVARNDVDALLTYRERAPGVREALPTHEHFVPLVVALGASADQPGPVEFPVQGFAYGSLTKRSVQFG